MTGSRRREEIVSKIKSSEVPVPGKELAKVYDVSRQVIVQDIALIRAAGYDIISTNRIYSECTAYGNESVQSQSYG